MPDDSKPKGFPDISAKLSALPKKSVFERQKAEAEAKRAREQAETAAVYEDFVKSFEDDNQAPGRFPTEGRVNAPGNFNNNRNSGFGGPAKRHFTSSGPRSSGPGTLGPPPPSLSRKRTHDGFPSSQLNRDSGSGVLGFGNTGTRPTAAFGASDDEEERTTDAKEAERAAAKPTLYLASLPPGTSPSVIKSLISSTLVVDGVKILRPPSQSSTDRKSVSAIVTLVNESAASDIDSAVSALQNKYLGWGYNLSITRHLSSAAISSSMPVTIGLSSTTSLPFGAKNISQNPGGSLSRAPPPGSRGFAPPSSYGPAYGRGGPSTRVEVKTPSDLRQLKLIHKTLENLLDFGPEFEALLMSRPEVQREEKWAWLWDPRSPGGVYYRWKLWEILTNTQSREAGRRTSEKASMIFEDGPSWLLPETNTKFEYTTRMDEFVSDEDYNSSDEEHSDTEEDRRNAGGAPSADGLGGANEGSGYMNPLQKAKLTHLLARLPTTHAKLRKGDVARITAFAIEHAGAGADEVVQMIVSNILSPLAYTGANPDREIEKDIARGEDLNDDNGSNEKPTQTRPLSFKVDTSAAKLVGLYLISDILSSSATSGVRHAWRYRQLFESALKSNQVFEHLGQLEKYLKWGRLKAEKWKRSIENLLHLWEGWCVFPQGSQEHFAHVFDKPPLTEEEQREEREKAEAEQASNAFAKGKSRWKTLDEEAAAATGKFDPSRPPIMEPNRMDIDQERVTSSTSQADFDGESMSDIDGVPMEDSDLEEEVPDGEPMEDEPPDQKGEGSEDKPSEQQQQEPAPEPQRPARKPRPKAEDMFADSDPE